MREREREKERRDTYTRALFLSSPVCFSYSDAVVGTHQIKSRLTIFFSNAADIASRCIFIFIYMYVYIHLDALHILYGSNQIRTQTVVPLFESWENLSLIYSPAPRNQPFNKLGRLSWQTHLTIDIQNIHRIYYTCGAARPNELSCAICILAAAAATRVAIFAQEILLPNRQFSKISAL